MAIAKYEKRFVALFCALWVALFNDGCGHASQRPLSDDELTTSFKANASLFAAVADAYANGAVKCSETKDEHICELREPSPVIDALVSKARLSSTFVKRGTPFDGVWMPVQTYGRLSISSSTRGYVYLKSGTTTSLVANTLDVDAHGTFYRQMSGHWYIFVTN